MKRLIAFLLIALAFYGAFWMSSLTSQRGGYSGESAHTGVFPENGIPQPPLGGGPAAFLEYAYQLQTATAEPLVRATQMAQMTAQAIEQRIFTDGLTATAAYLVTQQSLNLTATPVAQTATAQFEETAAAYQLTQQAITRDQLTQTATTEIAATSLAQTQVAPLIRARADALRNQSYTRLMIAGLFAVVIAVAFLFVVVQYREYLDDRRTKRKDDSIRTRIVPRDGASPLYFTLDGRPIDVDKAFHPDATKPAPSIEHQERVTQRAQAVNLAREVAKAMSAQPGTHTANHLAAALANLQGDLLGESAHRPFLPKIQILDTPPAYALDVESRAVEEGEAMA